MIKHWCFIAVIGTLASCSGEVEKNTERELLPDPEKYVHDGYFEKQDTLPTVFVPDSSVEEISLLNPVNVVSFLGDDVMERLNSDEDFPSSSVVSSDKKQRLTFRFYPGSSQLEFAEFEVSYVNQLEDENLVDVQEFRTESGIVLGMTMGTLRSIKGEPDEKKIDEITTFTYIIDEGVNSTFVQRYNMPEYKAQYHFRNGYLIQYNLGFTYP